MPHQTEGIAWLKARGRGLLWLPPGAGKTVITLEALRERGCKRVLIVAPVSLLTVWRDELAKFYGASCVLVRGSKAKRAELLAAPNRYHVIGYEALRVDFDTVKLGGWDAIILDESHKVANPTAKITKRMLKLDAPVKIALNGTPIANSYADIWSVCEWLERGCLYGNFYAFRNIHAVMNPYVPGMILEWRNVEKIKEKVAHLIFRKTREEVLSHLPPLTEQIISFELMPAERRVYEQIRKESLIKIAGEDVPISNALVELMRLRQVTNGLHAFGYEGEGSKIKTLKELLETFPEDAKIIIFSQFKTTVDKLVGELKGAIAITGDVPVAERGQIVEKFGTDPTCRVLVMTGAGERGLNLQVANYTVLMDNAWSNAGHEQRVGRNWRTGQTKPVFIYSLEAAKTVDVKIRKLLETKKGLAESFGGITKAELVSLLDEPF